MMKLDDLDAFLYLFEKGTKIISPKNEVVEVTEWKVEITKHFFGPPTRHFKIELHLLGRVDK